MSFQMFFKQSATYIGIFCTILVLIQRKTIVEKVNIYINSWIFDGIIDIYINDIVENLDLNSMIICHYFFDLTHFRDFWD